LNGDVNWGFGVDNLPIGVNEEETFVKGRLMLVGAIEILVGAWMEWNNF